MTFTINDEVAPLSIPDDVPEFHRKPSSNKDKKKGDSDGIGPVYTIDAPKKKYHPVSILFTFGIAFQFLIPPNWDILLGLRFGYNFSSSCQNGRASLH